MVNRFHVLYNFYFEFPGCLCFCLARMSHVVRGQILAERVQERAEALERQLSELDTLQTNDAT